MSNFSLQNTENTSVTPLDYRGVDAGFAEFAGGVVNDTRLVGQSLSFSITNNHTIKSMQYMIYPQVFVSSIRYANRRLAYMIEFSTDGGATWQLTATESVQSSSQDITERLFGDHIPGFNLAPGATINYIIRQVFQGDAAGSGEIWYATITYDLWYFNV